MWLFNSHDNRAELTKNFASEQAVYCVDLANNTVTMQSGRTMNKDIVATAFNACPSGGFVKPLHWFDDNWLAEKSDAFELAYISASRNLSALRYTLDTVRLGFPVYSVRYLCGETPSRPVVIPNVPVVYISFLDRTDQEVKSPANYVGNWFTGMCLAGHCADEDFLPRNDSIFYDAVAPQMTANQEAAVKALYATGTPEFWIAAAHANGLYGKDAEIAGYAAMQNSELADGLSHGETPGAQVDLYIEYAIAAYVGFLILGGIAITIRAANRLECKKTSVVPHDDCHLT